MKRWQVVALCVSAPVLMLATSKWLPEYLNHRSSLAIAKPLLVCHDARGVDAGQVVRVLLDVSSDGSARCFGHTASITWRTRPTLSATTRSMWVTGRVDAPRQLTISDAVAETAD